jgi:hypothetical protein
MNTALANNQGELVLPVIVTGSFQHPQVVPDVQQIAQMKLHNLLPTSKNPGQLTNGVLGALFGNKNQGGTNAQPSGGQQKGGLGGIVDALSGKQQQQNQQPQQGNPAVGNNQGQQPQATPTPAPNPGDMLNQMLNKKKKASPTPTPQN